MGDRSDEILSLCAILWLLSGVYNMHMQTCCAMVFSFTDYMIIYDCMCQMGAVPVGFESEEMIWVSAVFQSFH